MMNLLNLPSIRESVSIRLVLFLPPLIFIFLLFSSITNKHEPVNIISGNFLGGEQRNYYGKNAPDQLSVIWKLQLGCSYTVYPNKNRDIVSMCGAGWTGQSLVISDKDETYLIQGAYDYGLRKINADNGQVEWKYDFDDVIKSTGSFWVNPNKQEDDPDKYVIFQGSRLGFRNRINDAVIPSYRAISFRTGEELWRYNVRKGPSYSRDVDGSAILLDDTLFIGLENGYFVKLNPNPDSAKIKDGILQPLQYLELPLYEEEDIIRHRRNVITESAPALLGNHIYITSGSGHVYGYNRLTGKIDFDFFTGSDIDGSPVVTRDSCLLIPIEKQYIAGLGGVMKIDPRKHTDSCVLWFMPVRDTLFASWEGGIIGSCGINDRYVGSNENSLAAFIALDGYLYVVDQMFVNPDDSIAGPCAKKYYQMPQLVFKYYTGPSISTPIFVDDKLIVAGYHGMYLFRYNKNCEFILLDKVDIRGEATPVVYNGRIYFASRDGYLYCLGNNYSEYLFY
jgi:outer membrane protein assembly factor BamB